MSTRISEGRGPLYKGKAKKDNGARVQLLQVLIGATRMLTTLRNSFRHGRNVMRSSVESVWHRNHSGGFAVPS